MFRYLLPAALLLSGSAALSADRPGPAERRAADVARALDGLVAGTPQDCVDERRIQATRRLGTRIYYSYSPNEIYVTDTGGGCFGLERGDALITQTPSTRFCRGDIIRTEDLVSHTSTGSCVYGDFTPYIRPGR